MKKPATARVVVTGALIGIVAPAALSGCAIMHLIGGMAQNAEYQKQVQTLARYEDLEGKRVAVIVDVGLMLLYQYPDLVEKITAGVSLRIGRDVPGVQLVHPSRIIEWQWNTTQWNVMPYGDIAESLDVDRVVLIDLYEYRLNPPGNRWLWEGVCAANVSIVEREGFDPDTFADTFSVVSSFPGVTGVDRSGASAAQIEMGLLADFVKRTAWLFHEHLEPKYPDKFRPELQPKKKA